MFWHTLFELREPGFENKVLKWCHSNILPDNDNYPTWNWEVNYNHQFAVNILRKEDSDKFHNVWGF